MPRIKKEQSETGEAVQDALPAIAEAQAQPERKEGALLTLQDYKSMSLWKALQTMTDEDWADKMLYINRVQPFTVNKTTGEKYGSLDKGKFVRWTEEMFKDRFGGGRFHVWLKRGRDTCCEATPQWDGDVKLLVDEELKSRTQPSGVAVQPGSGEETAKVVKMFLEERRREREEEGDEDGAAVLDNAITLMSKASEKAIEIAAGGKNNAGSITELTSAMKTMHDMMAPREQLSVKDMMDMMLRMTDKLKPAVAENPSKPADPVTQLNTMMDLVDKLKERFEPQAAPGREDWKANLITAGIQLVQNLPAILQQQRQAQIEQFQMMLAARALQAPNGAVIPGMPPAGLARPGEPQPAAQPVPVGVPDAFADIKRHVVLMFKEGDEGSFVARMIQVVNPPLYRMLAAAPKDEIAKFIAQDAILREISDSADLPQFLTEMVQYFEDEAKPVPEGEPAAVVQ